MVLQQGIPVRIWGTAGPGEAVRVEFEGQSVSTTAGAGGKWEAWLKPLTAAGPLEMKITGASAMVVKDVLVGEVWLASGQSNMEFALSGAMNHDEEVAAADHPFLRLFIVKRVEADQPADDVTGAWEVCTPKTAARFSAVAYFFGRDLEGRLHVPMGLIESNWGGTPAQSWTSREALQNDPALQYVAGEWQRVLADPALRKPYPTAPFRLYNAMIAPLTPYAIRGAIWYQGESNTSETHAFRYRRLFATMIEDWRNRWGEGDFPFLFVQLANFKANGLWPVLRESQAEALRLRNTGMAVTIDIGNPANVHPTNKQEVGRRLALAARALVYGEAVEFSGPVYRQATGEGGALRVWFTHAEGMQAKGGGAVSGFTVAGKDGNFVPAEARIEGDTVVVSSPQVSAPAAVRYAWADDPECNLINREGLPAVPFRSGEPRYQ